MRHRLFAVTLAVLLATCGAFGMTNTPVMNAAAVDMAITATSPPASGGTNQEAVNKNESELVGAGNMVLYGETCGESSNLLVANTSAATTHAAEVAYNVIKPTSATADLRHANTMRQENGQGIALMAAYPAS